MDDNDGFEGQNPNLGKVEVREDDNNDEEDDEEEEGFSELQSSEAPLGVKFMESQPEFLAVSSSNSFLVTDQLANFAAASAQQLLAGEASGNSLLAGELKGEVGVMQEEILAGVTPETVNHPPSSQCPVFSPELSSSVTISQIPIGNQGHSQDLSDLKAISVVPIAKTASSDGYNWRKYGQKQVKSTKGSRSYYRCTYSDCSSKKIECSDHCGSVIETVYKGSHNHEPPRKVVNNPDSSSCSKESIHELSPLPERKRKHSRDFDGNVEIKDEKKVETESKQRLKKSGPGSPLGLALKLDKKPKLVVHAADDVGISSDGYRWRKYGQKMVKGNPHPRNYYRCTSAGCPVRKHIEKAIETTSALTLTYKGVHNHEMPVPKKRHGPPSPQSFATSSMASVQLKTCDALPCSMENEGGSELGGEKVMESARTLLSIGFEIKPC